MRAGVSGKLQVIDLDALQAYLDVDAEFKFLTSLINTLVIKNLEHARKLKTRVWHSGALSGDGFQTPRPQPGPRTRACQPIETGDHQDVAVADVPTHSFSADRLKGSLITGIWKYYKVRTMLYSRHVQVSTDMLDAVYGFGACGG